jgi:beta-glucanase (GH16 family)
MRARAAARRRALSRPSRAAHALPRCSFTSFNDTIWTQQTDIEHCNDGACFQARPDHLHYSPAGLTVEMSQEPCNTTSCCVGSKCASWASGHLATVATQAYGTYTATLQPAHRAGNATPPSNAFSCWTPSYRSTPHHEIAICFSGSDPTSVHFSYWYDATAHTTLLYPFPASGTFSEAPHDYRVVWAPTKIELFIDGASAHAVTGTTATLPSREGYMAVILRPKNTAYIADSYFYAARMGYDEAY